MFLESASNNALARAQEIAYALELTSDFDAQAEIDRRIGFLHDYLRHSSTRALVLGISGGVDSSTAGRLCQMAVERAREAGYEARFVAMRLPYGIQRDEHDCQRALAFIRPDITLAVNIKPASDAMLESLRAAGHSFADAVQQDFVLGNIKARQRMIAQYAVAGSHAGLVVGTDHAAEAVMGFFTKFGDGGCDLTPLTGLNKRRVRALATQLGASPELVHKIPTADLEELRPQLPDEQSYGISYQQIDDFLECLPVAPEVSAKIINYYQRTEHKRAVPVTPRAWAQMRTG